MNAKDVAVVVAAIAAGGLGMSLHRRRGFLARELRYRVATAFTYLAIFIVLLRFTEPARALLIALLVYAVILVRWQPRHSRYVSRRERRKVIARFERSGERYDPQKHEIDHVVPHSRGGMSTADNLRVIARARNRAKSDRSPWWDVFGR
ncbi:MAG TPA: HNH endonuclease signature motif containing protein [Candidatus Binataceae bacterium]|nr:HNH endonuclease signature motif containing protein [Candidatus Binataceae bacterium]